MGNEKKKSVLGVLFLVLRNFGFVAGHVELRRPFATDDRQSLFRRRLVAPVVQPAVLILGFDVEDVFHVQLERFAATGADHSRPFVYFKSTTSC